MRPHDEEDALQRCAFYGAKAGERKPVEGSGIGLWSWCPESREFLCSSEWLEVFGLPAHTPLTGDDWLTLIHPDDRDLVRSEMDSAIARRGLFDVEFRVVCPDGTRRWVLCKGRATGRGQQASVRGIVLDLTARKELERERQREIKQKYEGQLRLLASELSQAEQRERDRMAQVLHDHLQQLLVAAKFQVRSLIKFRMLNPNVASRFEVLEDLLMQAIHACRSFAVELSPAVLELGLGPALKWLAGWMNEKHGLSVTVHVRGDCQPVDKELQLLLFQSAQELLLNVVKHANVNDAELRVESLAKRAVRLTVRDRGTGFDAIAMRRREGTEHPSFGLFNIKQKVELIGGKLRIRSRPGLGAKFDLIVPQVSKHGVEVDEVAFVDRNLSTSSTSSTSSASKD
jgi:two-component system sensor histidine kinase UhpB